MELKVNIGNYPDQVDIRLIRGDTRKIVFKIEDIDGAPVDVSLWESIYLTANKDRTPLDDRDQKFQLIGEVGEELETNTILFTPDKEAEAFKGFYDIQITDGDGEIATIVMGRMVVLQDITKD